MEIWENMKISKIFQGIDESNIKALNFCFKSRLRFIEKGEIIVNAGDANEYCIYILEGSVRAVNYNPNGTETLIKTYEKGSCYGVNEAFMQVPYYTNTLVANKKSTIILFNRYRFVAGCDNECPRHKKLINNLLKDIAESNNEMQFRINLLTKRTMREKILTYLEEIAKTSNSKYFDIPLNRQELANYLSVDRSALSIELAKMKKEKIIDYNKNHFIIKE